MSKSPIIETLVVSAGQVVSFLGVFILLKITTSVLNPKEYGSLALFLTALTLVNQVVMGGIINSVGRFFSIAKQKNQIDHYITASIHATLTGAIVVIICAALIFLISRELNFNFNINGFALVTAYAILSSFIAAFVSYQHSTRERIIATSTSISEVYLKVLFVIIFTGIMGNNFESVLAGYLCSGVIVALAIVLTKQSRIRSIEYKSIKRDIGIWYSDMFSYAWPYALWGVFTWLHLASDRWALKIYVNIETIGHYAFLYQIGFTTMSLAASNIMVLISPIVFDRYADGIKGLEARRSFAAPIGYINVAITCLVILTIVSYFISDIVVGFLSNSSFQKYSNLLPLFISAGGLFAIGQLISVKIAAELRQKTLLLIKVSTAIVGTILNIVLAKYFGMIGVSLSLVLFSAMYVLSISKYAMQSEMTDLVRSHE